MSIHLIFLDLYSSLGNKTLPWFHRPLAIQLHCRDLLQPINFEYGAMTFSLDGIQLPIPVLGSLNWSVGRVALRPRHWCLYSGLYKTPHKSASPHASPLDSLGCRECDYPPLAPRFLPRLSWDKAHRGDIQLFARPFRLLMPLISCSRFCIPVFAGTRSSVADNQ